MSEPYCAWRVTEIALLERANWSRRPVRFTDEVAYVPHTLRGPKASSAHQCTGQRRGADGLDDTLAGRARREVHDEGIVQRHHDGISSGGGSQRCLIGIVALKCEVEFEINVSRRRERRLPRRILDLEVDVVLKATYVEHYVEGVWCQARSMGSPGRSGDNQIIKAAIEPACGEHRNEDEEGVAHKGEATRAHGLTLYPDAL